MGVLETILAVAPPIPLDEALKSQYNSPKAKEQSGATDPEVAAALTRREGAGPHYEMLSRKSEERDLLEGELVRQIPEMNVTARLRWVDRNAVISALPGNSVLVECVRLLPPDLDLAPTGEEHHPLPGRYLAFVSCGLLCPTVP